MPLAIDVSNFTGPIEGPQAAALRAAGVRRAVVGTQYPQPPYPAGCAHLQIPALLEAGIEVEAYVYLWFGDDPARQVQDARDAIAPWRDRVRRLWIDVEDESAPLDQDTRAERLRVAIEACGTMPAGIYTAAWYWRPFMGDTRAFSSLPLWAAQYDGGPDVLVAPFGGWTSAAMKQYAADVSIAGLSRVDLDWFEASPTPLTEAEFGFAFAALYRGMDGAQVPIRVRWGEPHVDTEGNEVHPLVVRGRVPEAG
ncbi:MAG: GH25 family lysozyme [Dehalococcoidia bacterium]